MTEKRPQSPQIAADRQQPSRLQLSGRWTLRFANQIEQRLAEVPDATALIDVRAVDRLDSVGVLQLMRFAKRRGLAFEQFEFDEQHRALVDAIDDVADDRPRPKREFGVAAALARLGYTVHDNWNEFLALLGFFGEVMAKMLRMVRQPARFRATATIHHMEQVGLDAVPLVALLCYLVGAVVAFLGATILADFGAVIFVVDLVSIAFLREFAVLLTAILLAGRTASAFTAQIGAMVSREEVDAIRTLGMDPIDLLVIPRVLALLIMLPLLTFVAMIFGLAGGLTVGAYALDIPPPQYLARMQDSIGMTNIVIGLVKAPVFALVISLIGCLEGLQVKGTAQSVGERTTSSVVQAISLVIIIDAFAAIWFMKMGF